MGRKKKESFNDARKEMQVAEIVNILIDGAAPWEVEQYIRDRETGEDAVEPWITETPIPKNQIDILCRAAEAIMIDSAAMDIQALLAKQILQRRALYARAVGNGELSIALACLREEANLLGLYGKKEKGRSSVSIPGEYNLRVDRIVATIEGPSAQNSPEETQSAATCPGGADLGTGHGPRAPAEEDRG